MLTFITKSGAYSSHANFLKNWMMHYESLASDCIHSVNKDNFSFAVQSKAAIIMLVVCTTDRTADFIIVML